jgi:hypothetical protein
MSIARYLGRAVLALALAVTGCWYSPWSYRVYEHPETGGLVPSGRFPCSERLEPFKLDGHLLLPVIRAHNHTTSGGTAPYRLWVWVLASESAYTELIVDSLTISSSIGLRHRLVDTIALPASLPMRPDSTAESRQRADGVCVRGEAKIRALFKGEDLIVPAPERSESLTVRMKVRMLRPGRDTTQWFEFLFVPRHYKGRFKFLTA